MTQEETALRQLLDSQGLLLLNDGVYEPDGTLLFLTGQLDTLPDNAIHIWLPETYPDRNWQSCVLFADEVNWWSDPRPREITSAARRCDTDKVLTEGPDLRKLAQSGREALAK